MRYILLAVQFIAQQHIDQRFGRVVEVQHRIERNNSGGFQIRADPRVFETAKSQIQPAENGYKPPALIPVEVKIRTVLPRVAV